MKLLARTLPFLILVLTSCSTVSETGRRRIAWFPASVVEEMGVAAYAEAVGPYREITGTAQAQMVQRMGRRIAQASGANFDWEFKLLHAPDVVNAFALPGGKVAIYSGILEVAQGEDGLAAIVGHEVAHATAQHGNERMTQNLLAQVGLTALDGALGTWGEMSAAERQEMLGYLGVGAQVGVLLPFSRKHESEADEIGLRYLIRAGYDPNEAPLLWERMAARAGPNRQPEFLSTHPDPLKRAQRLRELIPQMLAEERP